MKTVLLTGCNGFIGKHRTKHLINSGNSVIGVSHINREVVTDKQLIADISEKGSLDYIVARYKPDLIEHFASQAIVSVSRTEPYYTYKTNVLGMVNVCEVGLKYNIPVMAFVTDKYYGNVSSAEEDSHPLITPGTYENSKMLQDYVAQSYHKQGLDIKIVRSCNVYGKSDPNRRIIPNTIRDLVAGKTPFIFSNIIGKRQYLYISDLMSALDKIIGSNEHICNIGTSDYLAQDEVVKAILRSWRKITGKVIEPIYKLGPDIKEIPEQYLQYQRLLSLGWRQRYSFNDGINEIIEDEYTPSNSNIMDVDNVTHVRPKYTNLYSNVK